MNKIMGYTRLLKHMMSGADVKAAKDRLVELGYLYASTHDTFGNDTLAAVKSFQKDKGLEMDGIIGPDTWGATEPSEMAASLEEGDVYIYCPTMP